MKTNKLFQILVMGGALVTTGVSLADSSGQRSAASVFNEAEEAGELAPAFCDPQKPEFCEVDANGKAKVKDGFECCWGTSCG